MTSVVVLGGGPAGLAAAWEAASAGHTVTLLEQAERTGGMAASFAVCGITADHGSHRLHPAIDPELLAALQKLPGLQLERRPRHGRIRIAGRWLEFPLRLGNVVRSLPPGMAVRAALDASTSWARRPAADTYAEVVRSTLGPMMADRFYNPYARKLWGVDPHHLAGEQARRRISAGSPWTLARKVLRPDPDAGWFWYPRTGGFGAITAAMDRAARAAGAEIRTSCRVERVRVTPEDARVLGGGATVEADLVLSTLPVRVLARLVDPPAPASVRAAADRLRTRAMVLVYLVVAGRFSAYDAHYLPEPLTPVSRLSEPPNYSGTSPDEHGGHSLLCAEIPCDLGDAVWTSGDDDLARIVLEGIAGVGLAPPTVRHVTSRRIPNAYPVMTLDAPAARDRIESWAAALPRLLSFGRHGLYAHDNTHHALAEARAAVRAITAASRGEDPVDRAAWDRARLDFRRHVVED